MENITDNAEKNLGLFINELIKEKQYSCETSNNAPTHKTSIDTNQETNCQKLEYEKFLNNIIPTKNWWYEIKHIAMLVLLVALVVFVVCKCFDILERYSGVPSKQTQSYYCVPCYCDLSWRVPFRCAPSYKAYSYCISLCRCTPFPYCVSSDHVQSSGILWVLFGVVLLLFIGVVVVAIFSIKSSKAYYADKNERENKALIFRLKMMETAFELENRKIIAEKNSNEKQLSTKEKEMLYSMDEKQRTTDYEHKIQLRQYELVENYMNHITEIEKQRIIGKQSD